MERLREISVIWMAELGRAIRSARILVLLLLYVAFTAISGLGVHGCASGIRAQTERQISALEERGMDREEIEEAAKRASDEGRKEFIRAFFSDDERLTEALLATPLALLIVFKLSLFFLPFYAALMGFDQLSGEMGPRSIRYLAVRCRRSSVMYGKFLTQLVLLGGLMLVIDLALCFYGLFAEPDFSVGDMLLTLAKLWASAVVFSLAYLGLTTLCSAITRQPALSLLNNLLALFVIWVAGFLGDPPRVGDRAMFTPVPYLKYASVWYFRTDLLHPQLSQLAIAVVAHLGFAALFLGGAHLVLSRRDL